MIIIDILVIILITLSIYSAFVLDYWIKDKKINKHSYWKCYKEFSCFFFFIDKINKKEK